MSDPHAMSTANDLAAHLTGTWRLERLEVIDEHGNVTLPWGEQPTGRITYLPSGLMSVVASAGQRPPLSVPIHFNAPQAEQAFIARTCIAYTGRWTAHAAHVEHMPDTSLNPNYLTGTEVRNVTLDGDRLILSAPPTEYNGSRAVRRLIWKRESTL